MQRAPGVAPICPTCGAALEETFGGGGGCMFCLLQAGIGNEEEAAKDSTPDALENTMRFGVYEIDCYADGSLCELGRGAMGVTYRATDTSLQRKVALKIIKADIAERSADARERFVREARAAAALRHEHIATVYQFGMRLETGQYFYAMELIEGETLDERVHRAGPLDARTTIGIGQQVTSALAAAEKHGLIHRDLKPANLMLVKADAELAGASTERGGYENRRGGRRRVRHHRGGTDHKHDKLLVKIIDFGLAKAFHATTDPKSLTHDRFVGTPAFASPEQFERSSLDVRSDIYSLGETLWFALTGKTPFGGRTLSEIHEAQRANALPFEQLKAAHVPHGLKSLLASMLAFEPASRPGTTELAARLKRSSPEARNARRTRAALAIATVLVIGLSTLFIGRRLGVENTALNLVPGKTVAVLPFENLSPDPNNVYFADGVQDEILTHLASLADLKVINRTSVMQYKSGAARDLRTIGDQLGVARVVEGSVQRAGNRVRVNAQLIDVSTNRALWAQSYDRDLADVFAIQSEIAISIAQQLQATISPREKAAIKQAPTNDLVAFDLYTRAKTLLLSTSFSANNQQSLQRAIELLNQAVARDPSFFEAYYQLVYAQSWAYSVLGDHTPARLASAEAALQTATELQPDTGETHLARANYLYLCLRDYNGALVELEAARRSLPNDPRIFLLTGSVLRRRGEHEEGVRNLERSVELDPRNPYTLQQLAISYQFLRRYPEEAALLDRALTIVPNDGATKAFRALVDFNWKAETRPLHEAVDSILAAGPDAISDAADAWLQCALAERDAPAGGRALVALGDNPSWADGSVILSRSFGEGLLARMMNDESRAHSAFSRARLEQEKVVQAQPNYGPALCVLGLIDAALGRKEEALHEGRRAIALLPLEKDSTNGSQMRVYFAIIAAWAGEKGTALEYLATNGQSTGGYIVATYGALKLLPFWDPLRGDPRFEKIVAALAPKKD